MRQASTTLESRAAHLSAHMRRGASDNIVVRVPATLGHEQAPTVILQNDGYPVQTGTWYHLITL